jgi:hypothetical protein
MERIVASVRALSTTELEELFKILHISSCEYSRNNNGIFMNLKWLSESMLVKIERFIDFCAKSRRELDKYETLRQELHLSFQSSRVASRGPAPDEPSAVEAPTPAEAAAAHDADARRAARLNSSMRFYLLKKRFAKPNAPAVSRGDAELRHEPYLIP